MFIPDTAPTATRPARISIGCSRITKRNVTYYYIIQINDMYLSITKENTLNFEVPKTSY